MAWELNNKGPIYSQIVENIKLRIISGYYGAGSRIPSVRELAQDAGVNPNTMQKAFTELERSGLIVTMRTSGRTVTEDVELIKQTRENIAEEEITDFFDKMKKLGYEPEETIELSKKVNERQGKMGE